MVLGSAQDGLGLVGTCGFEVCIIYLVQVSEEDDSCLRKQEVRQPPVPHYRQTERVLPLIHLREVRGWKALD